jgi:hypothetical protein
MDGTSHTARVFLEGYHRVPNVNANSEGDFNANLGNFEKVWNQNNAFFYFSDYQDPFLFTSGGFVFQTVFPTTEHTSYFV